MATLVRKAAFLFKLSSTFKIQTVSPVDLFVQYDPQKLAISPLYMVMQQYGQSTVSAEYRL